PDPQLTAQPWAGTALAVRAGRLVSVILGTLAVGCTFLAGRALFPRQPALALLATALHAFWPLLLGIGSVITNDVAIALFGSLTLWLCARIWQRRAQGPAAADLVLLAVCLAGASLTKDSAVALILFGAVIVAGTARLAAQRRHHSILIRVAALFVMPLIALLIVDARLSEGRSMRQFIGAGDMAIATGSVATGAAGLTGETNDRVTVFIHGLQTYGWRFAFDSLFGAFGWGAIRMPPEWYWIARVAAGAALIGLLLALKNAQVRSAVTLLAIGLFCVGMAPVARTFLAGEPGLLMGRFFLPGLSALCLLLAIGLRALPGRRVIALTTLGGIAWTGLATPFLVIGPAVARPPFVLSPYETMRDIQQQTDIVYADSIRLLGYSLTDTPASRANGVTIVLYWQSLRRVEADYRLRLELFTFDGRSLYIQRDFEPGFGRFPTSEWMPGDTFAEYYHLPLWPNTPVPVVAQVQASWISASGAVSLAPRCEANPCEGRFGAIPVRLDDSETERWRSAPARFIVGDQIDLVDVIAPTRLSAEEPIRVTLVWRSRAVHPLPRTAFVHLLDTSGSLVTQSDAQPCQGNYPTPFWSPGEIVLDTHTLNTLTLTSGRYRLAAGMYDSQTGVRLSVVDATGRNAPDDLMILADLDIADSK
ncbi:MAG: glycosyltransferase family 39 protein, partial [Candidatus Roseilinea sp.]|uniref:glycosyltransferase family 39 protein n=1 Tax=Candidatus Roseilinea sp. TaxID=2838777 RepID=UPI004049AD75